jgi:uncharacterized protein RhaS with RHS repeats
MQARYYDPMIGRFYSNDPIGIRDVHSFNRYAYAANNPYKYVDPDGMYFRVRNESDRDKVLGWVNENSSDEYKFTDKGYLEKVSEGGNGNGSKTFTNALDEIIGYGAGKGVSVQISQNDPAGRDMDEVYKCEGTNPSGDMFIMSGNGAILRGR